MTISNRIRKIREIRGWKQSAVASSMKITQQAYSCLEHGAENARLETLKRFCEAMNVELSYLLALEVVITEESLSTYGAKNYNDFLTSYKKLEQKLEFYDDLLNSNSSMGKHLMNNATRNISTGHQMQVARL